MVRKIKRISFSPKYVNKLFEYKIIEKYPDGNKEQTWIQDSIDMLSIPLRNIQEDNVKYKDYDEAKGNKGVGHVMSGVIR